MAKVETWFPEFMKTHAGRFPRADWDKASQDFWDGLETMFTRRGVTEQEAHEASARLFETPPAFISDHPPRLMAAVEAIRRETGTPPPSPPRTFADGGPAWTSAMADAKWERTPEAEREHWRNEVRRKLPELVARGGIWLEGLARGWNMDPELAASIGEVPPPRTGPPPKPGTPRTPFVEMPTPQPKGA